MNEHLWEIFAIIVAFLSHFLGIKIGGTAALRAAALPVESKSKFPWSKVIQAFLEFLLQVLKSPGVLNPKKGSNNGRDRQIK